MADQSDVETSLVQLAASILYPDGPAAASIVGRTCRIYRGWPNQSALDADLAAGHVNVTVFPEQGHERNTTRYPAEYQVTTKVEPLLFVSVSGDTASFSGAAAANQLVGLLADNVTAVYRTIAGDTPGLVAAILADQLRASRIALASGNTVIVPNAASLIGRVVADQPARMETRRQRQGFRLICWCPDPDTRDAVASAIDAALSLQTFIALSDGSAGRLRFHTSTVLDQSQDAALYRRDLLYTVDYPTTVTTLLPSMLFGEITVAPDGAGIAQSLFG